MSEPLPLPPPIPPEANTGPQAAAGERQKEKRITVWFDLLDRLAVRKSQHEAHEALKAAQPPSRAQVWLDWAVWRVILFARWLRPHLARRAATARKATRNSWRRNSVKIALRLRELWLYSYGWMLWQLRLLRTDPDRRLAATGLGLGFFIPMALIIILSSLMPSKEVTPPSDAAILAAARSEPDALPSMADPSVPAPQAIITASPGEQPDVIDSSNATTALPPAPTPEPLSVHNFRFELFARRDEQGNLQLLNPVAQAFILQNYPLGSPAVGVMRFFGEVMMRSGAGQEKASLAAQARCIAMPVNKVFVVKTVVCTYGHDVPLPRRAHESTRNRVFWIMALSYDRGGRLLDLRLHARTTLAAP